MASLEQFFNHIKIYGIARSNRFEVVIPLPQGIKENIETTDDRSNGIFDNPIIRSVIRAISGAGETEVVRGLNTMCKISTLPGKSFSTAETRTNGDYYKPAYGIIYDDISMTFNLSRDYFEKNIIDRWMGLIVDPNTKEAGYFNDYVVDINIRQLDQQDNIVHEIQLKDAYPITTDVLTNDNSQADAIHELNVQWAYRKWENVTVEESSQYDVSALSQTPLGPLVEPFMNDPGIKRALAFVEESTGISLEGEAVNVYNQINDIVVNTTGSSINRSKTLLNNKKGEILLNRFITDPDKTTLTNYTDDILSFLGD